MLKSDGMEARRHQAELAAAQQETLKANVTRILKKVNPGVIAEKLQVSEQAVSGWKRTGKIAPHYLLRLAEVAGWTVDQLLRPEGAAALDLPMAGSPVADATPIPAQYAQTIADLDVIPPTRRQQLLADIHHIAEDAREILEYHGKDPEEKAGVTSSAALKRGPGRATATVNYGDGNSRQGSLLPLPLIPSDDPFTASPDERESALYRRIGRVPKSP